MIERICILSFSLASLLLLSACSNTMTLDYNPKTTAEVRGALNVNAFKYLKGSDIEDNEIVNLHTITGRGLHLTESVSSFVTTAVRRELRQAGISLRDAHCSLDGDINQYSFEMSLLGDTYISDIHYVLRGSTNNVLYDNDIHITFDAALINRDAFQEDLNKTISDNIEKLLIDAKFTSSVERNCR